MSAWPRAARSVCAVAMLVASLASVARAGTDEAAPGPARVEWNPRWSKFRWWEYAATPVLGAAALYLHYVAPLPAQAKWQGDNPADGAFRGWLVAETFGGRARAEQVSDVLWIGGTAFPFAVDLPVILIAHRQPRLAWQVMMMDFEANAVAGFINNALFYQVGRGRPSYPRCDADPSYDPLCGGTGNNASFPSGHVLGIATGAGLTCVHHRYLPLYGHAAADAGACVIMSIATAVTGVTRVIADRHYMSDVVVGAAIGFASGYGLPWLLHYRTGAGKERAATNHVFLLPFAGARSLGLGVAGLL